MLTILSITNINIIINRYSLYIRVTIIYISIYCVWGINITVEITIRVGVGDTTTTIISTRIRRTLTFEYMGIKTDFFIKINIFNIFIRAFHHPISTIFQITCRIIRSTHDHICIGCQYLIILFPRVIL